VDPLGDGIICFQLGSADMAQLEPLAGRLDPSMYAMKVLKDHLLREQLKAARRRRMVDYRQRAAQKLHA